jgi:branched-chain amino acid aminotransferase
MIAIIDGEDVVQAEACVPVMDRGSLYGDALFETIGVAYGQSVAFEDLLARLDCAAASLGIRYEGSARLADLVMHSIGRNELDVGVVRLILTRGSSPRGLATRSAGPARVIVLAFNAAPPEDPERAPGWLVVATDVRRVSPEAMPVLAKTANYLPNVLAFRQAKTVGAQEALMRSAVGDGYTSGTFGNLIAVSGNNLLAPGAMQGAMPGIARARIIAEARRMGMAVEERAISLAALIEATEVFLCNSVMLVKSIGQIDGVRLAAGRSFAGRFFDALSSSAAVASPARLA